MYAKHRLKQYGLNSVARIKMSFEVNSSEIYWFSILDTANSVVTIYVCFGISVQTLVRRKFIQTNTFFKRIDFFLIYLKFFLFLKP